MKKNKDVKLDEPHEGAWAMNPAQMVYIEVDSKQASTVNRYLNRRYNKETFGIPKPGGYRFRYQPEAAFVISGKSNGNKSSPRSRILDKHVAVIKSLRMIMTSDISQLDKEIGGTTLRAVLMDMYYPIGDRRATNKQRLIHSIDFASSGPFAGQRVLVTAYEDRVQVVEQLMYVLPEYINHRFGQEEMKAWCVHRHELLNVEFIDDENGNFTGNWTTEDDKLNADLLSEDVGYNINIENIDLLNQDQPKRRVFTQTDASVGTFLDGQTTQASDADSLGGDLSAVSSAVSGGDDGET